MAKIKMGIVTDSHSGGHDEAIVEALKGSKLDAIAYLGDAPSNIQGPPSQQFGEIVQTLLTYDKVGVPVFVIPGNYEDFLTYHAAFHILENELDNTMDCSKVGKYTLKKKKPGMTKTGTPTLS
ncbi:metallophosphoesterase [Nanoarchaeota archaeon]